MRIARSNPIHPQFEMLEPRRLFSGGASGFITVTNLVSDGAVAASQPADPLLLNPWGIANAPGGAFWVADNNSGKATLYDGAGAKQGLVVNVPGGGGGTANPTGQVYNAGGGFQVHEGNGPASASQFIFVGEDGGISGWSFEVDQNNAILAVDHSASGAVYKGAALGTVNGNTELFVTNFHDGTVEVYDDHFAPVSVPGGFHDKKVPEGFAPFGIQNVGGQLIVTYAKQNAAKHDDVGGAGAGYVDVFSTSGKLVRRFQHNRFLNSPWGVTIAPASWGRIAGDILVGQFKSGNIDVFSKSGHFIGLLANQNKQPITIDGLWAVVPGAGAQNANPNDLYFSAGINDEADGLFGSLSFTPVAKKGPHGRTSGSTAQARNPTAAAPAPEPRVPPVVMPSPMPMW